jgi:hypothetical protein
MKNSALLIIAYYLSRFGSRNNQAAYEVLGFRNATDSFDGVAKILQKNRNTVKNYCDTFDPLHGHRDGWHQKKLPSRFKVIVEALKNIDEQTLAMECKKILEDTQYRNNEEYMDKLSITSPDQFQDLAELYIDLQNKTKEIEKLSLDQEIPFELQDKIKELGKGRREITFGKYCSKLIVNKGSNRIYVPNIGFYMAIEALPFYEALSEYNEVFKEVYKKIKQDGPVSKGTVTDYYKSILGSSETNEKRKLFNKVAHEVLVQRGKSTELDVQRFFKYVDDISWATPGVVDGGKSPGRPDTVQSPILTAFSVTHASQGFIYHLVELISRSDEDLSDFSILTGAVKNGVVASPRNLIVYGAPGTGKSHFIDSLLKNTKTIRTVFHSETQNSDFVGSLKPVTKKDPTTNLDRVSYEFIAGPFIQAFVAAIEKPEEQIHLIIEEINRANAAAVFGEIFQLLDRDPSGISQYQIQPDEILSRYLNERLSGNFKGVIFLPENLYLNATMNSSDQGVFPLDSAFKRRWSFKYMPIDFEACPIGEITVDERTITWRIFATSINEVLSNEFPSLDEDRLIGPWFLTQGEVASNLHSAIQSKIFTYLWNDVLRHHHKDKIFNEDNISTFGDLVKAFNQQAAGEKISIFSETVHAVFDRQLRQAIPTFQDTDTVVDDSEDESELENDS